MVMDKIMMVKMLVKKSSTLLRPIITGATDEVRVQSEEPHLENPA